MAYIDRSCPRLRGTVEAVNYVNFSRFVFYCFSIPSELKRYLERAQDTGHSSNACILSTMDSITAA